MTKLSHLHQLIKKRHSVGSTSTFLFFLLLSITVAGCKKSPKPEDSSTPIVREPPKPPVTAIDSTLKNLLPFPIGAAVKMAGFKNAIYANTLIKHFNSVTAENAMKFGPQKDLASYDFEDADYIVNLGIKNKMRVHGHCLIWPKDSGNSPYLNSFQGDSAAFDNLMKEHIYAVVKHFKGRVDSWDVVNEAFQEGSKKLKDNIWLRKIGPSFILKAFQYAHEADPDVLLFYNDYGQEFGGDKVQAMLDLAAEAKAKGIRFDGIGFQMHTLTPVAASKFESNAKKVVAAGLRVHVSELDITIKKSEGHTEATQAALYKDIFKAYMALPKWAQHGITTWGIGDGDSFYNASDKNAQDPLLFDRNYNPKLAYRAIIDAAIGR